MAESAGDPLPDDSVRVGHPERERAIGLLNDAFSSGYLEIAEFEERSGVVFGCKTRGELRAAVADLPTAHSLFPDTPLTSDVVSATSGAVAQPVMPVEFGADWETFRRKGVWQVPPRMLITGSMSTVDLDFTNASFTGGMAEVQLQVSVSTVKLRVGPDQEIRYETLSKTGWSSLKDKAGAPSRPGGQVINLIGSVSGMSGVTIKRS